MKLQTQRLSLRELSFTDLDNIHALLSLPETDAYNTLGIPGTKQATENIITEWLAGQKQNPRVSYTFCIDLPDTNQFIGLIGLNLGKQNYRTAEVWYKIHKNYWRNGYATEALTSVLEFCFIELKLHRIEAGCAVENMASIKVLEKVGMTKEGMKRKILPVRGDWMDNYFFAILEEDFFKS
ncbi:MAG: GNAT family protein [Chitinophagaceae bacterium]